jgi:aspartyl-tRNA(Asn)/glutamyl-tRNA(Gln) amidotransferase subunit B
LKADDKDFSNSPITPEKLGELIALIGKGELTGKLAKEVFPKMYQTGDSAPGHHGA